MWLRLDIDGFVMHMKINEYEPSIESVWSKQWCSVDFSLARDPWLNYQLHNYHILLSCEVEELAEALEDLLNDKLSETKTIECIEPDFNFVLNPKFNNGYSIVDIDMEMKIFFWDEGVTY